MKITNALISLNQHHAELKPSTVVAQPASTSSCTIEVHKPWYWEGNVQSAIVRYLKTSGVRVVSEANTHTREQGKDIEATNTDGSLIWVTVKGFPEKSPNTQARHWFAGALLDLALYKDQNPKARLALGLPTGFSTYENLVKRVGHTLRFLGCNIYWVTQGGIVTCEDIKNNTL